MGKHNKTIDRAYIENHSIPVPESGCWIWLGGLSDRGYGRIFHQYKSYYAHKVSYRLFVEEPKFFVCHKCDTPSCVNPDHLFDAPQAENVRDMVRKGRNYKPPRISNEVVASVISSSLKAKDASKAFGISEHSVGKVRRAAGIVRQPPKPRIRLPDKRKKLNEAQVLEIRSSDLTGILLARKFNICERTVWKIKSGERWKIADER